MKITIGLFLLYLVIVLSSTLITRFIFKDSGEQEGFFKTFKKQAIIGGLFSFFLLVVFLIFNFLM